MSWIDWAFIVLVTLSVIVGLVRGLVYEVMALLGWVVAYVAAVMRRYDQYRLAAGGAEAVAER